MSFPTLLLSLVLLAPASADVYILQFPARSKVSLSMGAKNKAEVERAGTVSRVSIQMDDLQPPQSVLGKMNTYVVWTVSPEGSFDNLGELEVSGKKGLLYATTRFDRFGIIVTAEPHYMVDKPNSTIVFKNDVPRAISSVPLTIDVGTYEYPNLPINNDSAPALVMEARAALAIASTAQAASRAGSEYRQARAALDTMEELFKRTSPPDVVASAANAAIRWAQKAATVARQSAR